jgi:hypothetical protein
LKEGLIKFQQYLEGKHIFAVTDHAALTWSKTFQNVNHRLLTWGLVFLVYPKLKIIHRAGRVHSNVDPISRLRRRVPYQNGPQQDHNQQLTLGQENDPLKNMYDELGPQFEEKLLTISLNFLCAEEAIDSTTEEFSIHVDIPLTDGFVITIPYHTSQTYTTVVSVDPSEIQKWTDTYQTDPHFAKILPALETDPLSVSQYLRSEDGLIYFQDGNLNTCLCVPRQLHVAIMDEVHNTISKTAHAGYYKSYNRINTTYYWPRMSREIKTYIQSCDICQKAKPCRHAPIGLLQPIPVPSRPFKCVTMDFIPELSEAGGFNNILVIINKLTKYVIFIPTTNEITEIGTARLFFHHIISRFGIPRQVISDCDSRWMEDFWGKICRLMGMKRSLASSYHPQADGQTEIMNQTLEIAIQAYISPDRDNWHELLDGLLLAYNSTPHTATGFSPAFLLMGYHPTTGSTLMGIPTTIPRPTPSIDHMDNEDNSLTKDGLLHEKSLEMVKGFEAERKCAQDALLLGQAYQKKSYNKGRLIWTLKVGDKVVLNTATLHLLKKETGRGKKFLMKYNRPFEVMERVSPVAYRIQLPASYPIHPVINIAHLEKYHTSPPEFREQPKKSLNRANFDILEEFEVEKIVGESWKKGWNGKCIPLYRVCYEGYGPEFDLWSTRQDLTNAPDIIREWKEEQQRSRKKKST